MNLSTRVKYAMAARFAILAPLFGGKHKGFPKGVITLTDFAEYLSCATTSTASLANRSLALMSKIAFLERGQTDLQHLKDLKNLEIGPDEVYHIDGGLIFAILNEEGRGTLKLIATKMREGYLLRLFHPIPQPPEERGYGPMESNKHNVLLIEALREELGWTMPKIWSHLIFNNTTTTEGAELNHSKAQQRRVIEQVEGASDEYHLPYVILAPSVVGIKAADKVVKRRFKKLTGVEGVGTLLKAPDGASGDQHYRIGPDHHTPEEAIRAIQSREGPMRKKDKLAWLVSKFSKRVKQRLETQTHGVDYLLVPYLPSFVEMSVTGIIIDTDAHAEQGVARGYHSLGITRQCTRLSLEGGKSWCGNMQVVEGMLLQPADPSTNTPALYASAEFLDAILDKVSAYMQLQYKLHEITGLNSVDLAVFYNQLTQCWEVKIFELNPRPTNGTTLCELMWQVDAAMRRRGIDVPDTFTGALIILKVPRSKAKTYAQQVQLLGDDFFKESTYEQLGAMPIVPTAWEAEGQLVYSFFAKDPMALHRLITRVWGKLGADGLSDSEAMLESLEV